MKNVKIQLEIRGTIFPAFGLVGVSYAECDKILAIILFIACFSTLGLFYPSVKVNPMDLSPNFAGTIGSIGQMGGCAAGVLVPYVTSFLTPNEMEFRWTAQQQGLIHGAFFWGYFITSMVGGVLSDMFNHKAVMLSGLLGTCIATFFTPIITRLFDWIGLIACRVIVGLSQGVFYNSLLAVSAHWIPPLERGTLGTIVFSGSHFGNSLNTISTGFLMVYCTWPLPFYIYSGIGFIFAIVFFFTTRSNPMEIHLTDRETEVFVDYMMQVLDKERVTKRIPIKHILRNKHVWAIVIATFGHSWSAVAIVVYTPTFIKTVLHLPTRYNAIYNSTIFLVIWTVGLFSGCLSDLIEKKNCISLTWNRKCFFLIGTLLPAMGFIGISYAECNEHLAITIMIVGFSTLGLYYPSVKVNSLDLSPNYASTIGALAQLGSCMAGVLVPYLFGLITSNGHMKEWRIVFWVSCIITLIGGLTFFTLATAKEQPFNLYYSDVLRGHSGTSVSAMVLGKRKDTKA